MAQTDQTNQVQQQSAPASNSATSASSAATLPSSGLPTPNEIKAAGGTLGAISPQPQHFSSALPTPEEIAASGGTLGVVPQQPAQTPEEIATIRHLRSQGITNPTTEQIQQATQAQQEGAENPNLEKTGLWDDLQHAWKWVSNPSGAAKEALTQAGHPMAGELAEEAASPNALIPGYAATQWGAQKLKNHLEQTGHPELANMVGHYQAIEKGLGTEVASQATPVNAAIMLATGGLGANPESLVETATRLGLSPKAAASAVKYIPYVQKIIDAGFSAKMIQSAYNTIPVVKKEIEDGDTDAAIEDMTHLTVRLGMAGMAAHSATEGMGQAIKETAADMWSKVPGRPSTEKAAAVLVPRTAREQIAVDQAMKNADPQIRDLQRLHPELQKTGTPQDYVDLINERIQDIEGGLRDQARELQTKENGQPSQESILSGAEDELKKFLNDKFKENAGAFKKPQIDAAIDAAVDRLRQGEGEEPRDPSLFEAENLRRQLSDENKPVYGQNNAVTAEKQAMAGLEQFLRQKIYDKYADLGVPDVEKWRKQEAGLITVRDHIERTLLKSKDNPGQFDLLRSMFNRSGWGALGLLLGHGMTGALGLESIGLAKDYVKYLETDPVRAARIYAKRGAKSPVGEPAAIPGRIPQKEEAPLVPSITEGAKVPSTVSKAAVAEEAPITYRTDDNGTRWAKSEDSPTEVSVPVRLQGEAADNYARGKLDLQKDFAANRGAGNPKGGEVAETPKENGQLLERLPKNKNAPGTVRDDIHHEMGHAIVANDYGVKTKDGILSDRHPSSLSSGSAAQIGIDFKLPPISDAEDFVPHLNKVLTILMGGGAGEEVTGGPKMNENRGMDNDEVDAQSVLTELGYSGDAAKNLLDMARKNALEILSRPGVADKMREYSGSRESDLPETHHMSQERLNQMLKEIDNGESGSNTARSSGKTEGGDQANVAGRKGKGAENAGGKAEEVPELVAKKSFAEVKPSKIAEGGKDFHEQKFPKSYEVEVTWPDGDKHMDEIKGLNEGHALSRAKGNWPDASDIKVLRETTQERGAAKTKLLPLVAGQALATGLALLAGHDWKKTENKQVPAPTPAAQPQPAAPPKVDIPSTLKDASSDFGVPLSLLKRQAMQESHLDPNAVSRKGAIGVMQLMPRTAKALGVDPQDTEENIRGGAAYLGRLHKHFKSWDKALASYDWGADNVQKAIDEWGPDWLEHTPAETQAYVQHILKKKSQVSP